MSKRAEQAALRAYPYETGVKGLICEQSRGIFIKGYEQAEKDTIERAVEWLINRIDIPCSVVTNENGEPLADSYIDYAKKRLEAANEIVDDFRKAMEEE